MEEDSGYNLMDNTLDIDSLLCCRLKHQLPTPSTEHYSTWDYTGRLGCIKAFFVGGKYVINVNEKMYSKGQGERKFRLVDSHVFDKKALIYCWLVHVPSPNGKNVEDPTERPGKGKKSQLVPSRISNTASPNIENNTEYSTSPTSDHIIKDTTLPPKINTEDILNWQEFLCRPPIKQHSFIPSDITTDTGRDTDKVITINTTTSVQDSKAIHGDNVNKDYTTVKQKKKKTLLSRLIHTLRKLCSCTKKRAAAAYDDDEEQ